MKIKEGKNTRKESGLENNPSKISIIYNSISLSDYRKDLKAKSTLEK